MEKKKKHCVSLCKDQFNCKKPPFKMATQTTKYLRKSKKMWDLNGGNCKAHIIQIIRRYTCVYEWKTQYHKCHFSSAYL